MQTSSSRQFDEMDVETFYDHEDSHYRSFWDPEGSLHWGYFDPLTQCGAKDFVAASKRWNEIMLEKSMVNAASNVLDLGCGNGNTALWLSACTQCTAVGVDISGVRISNAQAKIAAQQNARVSFKKASATALPFADASFTHVWSQATFYHVQNQDKALSEIARVLKDHGTFVFDTLTTPHPDVSQTSLDCLYHRLHSNPGLSFEQHVELLSNHGFDIADASDMSDQLLANYIALTELTEQCKPELRDIYNQVCESIQARDVGWAFFLCHKA